MSNKVVSIIVIVVVVVAGIFLFRNESAAPTDIGQDVLPVEPDGGIGDTPDLQQGEGPTPSTVGQDVLPVEPDGGIGDTPMVNEYVLTAKNFSFSVEEIRVKKGEMVRITLKNSQGVHDWRIDEFNAGTKIIQGGQEETIEFRADKAGTFEYYCSVGNHRALGMVGKLIVEE